MSNFLRKRLVITAWVCLVASAAVFPAFFVRQASILPAYAIESLSALQSAGPAWWEVVFGVPGVLALLFLVWDRIDKIRQRKGGSSPDEE